MFVIKFKWMKGEDHLKDFLEIHSKYTMFTWWLWKPVTQKLLQPDILPQTAVTVVLRQGFAVPQYKNKTYICIK
jgi:hypothetical protein